MARLLRTLDDEIEVRHATFLLLDAGAEAPYDGPLPGPLTALPGCLQVTSGGDQHFPAVRMEAWDSQPPALRPWEELHETTLTLLTGRIHLLAVTGSSSPQEFLVGPPHFHYGLQLYRHGVATVDALGGGTFRHGVERYLLRFWPLRDVYDPEHDADACQEPPVNTGADTPPVPGGPPEPRDWPSLQPYPDSPALESGSFPLPLGFTAEDGELAAALSADPDLLLSGQLPADFHRWTGSAREAFLARQRCSARIARELNPHRAPTRVLRRDELRRCWDGPHVGMGYRAWWWTDLDQVGSRSLSPHRQVVATDRLGDRALITDVVTVLRIEGNLAEVRLPTDAEAARVLRSEARYGG